MPNSNVAFSEMMTQAIPQATTLSQVGLANRPIIFWSLVNRTSGTTAKGSCRLRTTWLSTSSLVVPLSPYSADDDHRRDDREQPRHQPPQPDRQAQVEKALHHDLPGERAGDGGVLARGEQRDGEQRCSPTPAPSIGASSSIGLARSRRRRCARRRGRSAAARIRIEALMNKARPSATVLSIVAKRDRLALARVVAVEARGSARSRNADRDCAASPSRRGCRSRCRASPGLVTISGVGISPPAIAAPCLGCASASSNAKQPAMMISRATMNASSLRKPQRCSAQDQEHVERGDARRPRPAACRTAACSAIAVPITSARSQAMIASSHSTHSAKLTGRRIMGAAGLGEVEAGDDAEPRRQRLQHHRHQVRQQDDRQAACSRRPSRRRCRSPSCPGPYSRPRPDSPARRRRTGAGGMVLLAAPQRYGGCRPAMGRWATAGQCRRAGPLPRGLAGLGARRQGAYTGVRSRTAITGECHATAQRCGRRRAATCPLQRLRPRRPPPRRRRSTRRPGR